METCTRFREFVEQLRLRLAVVPCDYTFRQSEEVAQEMCLNLEDLLPRIAGRVYASCDCELASNV